MPPDGPGRAERRREWGRGWRGTGPTNVRRRHRRPLVVARNVGFCRDHKPPTTVKQAQSHRWKWERHTKSPSMITAKKHLQAVVSSGRGSRTAPKNYLAYQGAFTPKIKGLIYTSKFSISIIRHSKLKVLKTSWKCRNWLEFLILCTWSEYEPKRPKETPWNPNLIIYTQS